MDLLFWLMGVGFVVGLIALWVLCIRDIFQRDHTTGARVAWLIAIFIFPIIASCVYLFKYSSADVSPRAETWYDSGAGGRPPV
jgi:Phospholipase_D-nuclease N-terminal